MMISLSLTVAPISGFCGKSIGCTNCARKSTSLFIRFGDCVRSKALFTVSRSLFVGDDLSLLLVVLLQLSLILFGLVCLCEAEEEMAEVSDDLDLRDDFCELFGVELRLDDGLRCLDDDFLRSTNTTHIHTYVQVNYFNQNRRCTYYGLWVIEVVGGF